MNAADPWCQSSTSERNSIDCGVDADDVLVIVGARDEDDASAGAEDEVDAVVVGAEDGEDIGDDAFAGAGGSRLGGGCPFGGRGPRLWRHCKTTSTAVMHPLKMESEEEIGSQDNWAADMWTIHPIFYDIE